MLRDPSSWLQAAANDWKYPVSTEWMVLANSYDLLAAINSKKKPKPYPTPWKSPDEQKLGARKPQRRSDVIDRLAQMNPKENDG